MTGLKDSNKYDEFVKRALEKLVENQSKNSPHLYDNQGGNGDFKALTIEQLDNALFARIFHVEIAVNFVVIDGKISSRSKSNPYLVPDNIFEKLNIDKNNGKINKFQQTCVLSHNEFVNQMIKDKASFLLDEGLKTKSLSNELDHNRNRPIGIIFRDFHQSKSKSPINHGIKSIPKEHSTAESQFSILKDRYKAHIDEFSRKYGSEWAKKLHSDINFNLPIGDLKFELTF